jgi:ubiquinone/menaquinone biosynthesis C-methylase UbiE
MLYDDQAARYDERVGLSAHAARSIAQTIDAIAGLTEGTSVLEPGVGTGLVSIELLRYPVRYVGFDRSPEMLDVFRRKVDAADRHGELVVADGNERWPVADHSVDLVFCSRALHHIAAVHVASELDRVVRPTGGWLIVGRVRRPQESIKSQMRRQMRRLLRDHGFDGRSHDDHTANVLAALVREAHALEPVAAARWSVDHRPIDSIASWEGKEGLGGVVVPADVKRAVLDGVRSWAVERFSDLERPFDQEEIFELSPIHLSVI